VSELICPFCVVCEPGCQRDDDPPYDDEDEDE
jgi:hypothetical protein